MSPEPGRPDSSVVYCSKNGCRKPFGRADVDPFTAAVYRIGAKAFFAMSLDEQVQLARESSYDGEIHPPELVTDLEARETVVNLPTGVLGGWVLSPNRTGTEAHIPLPAVVWCISGHPNELVQKDDGHWIATKADGLRDDIRS